MSTPGVEGTRDEPGGASGGHRVTAAETKTTPEGAARAVGEHVGGRVTELGEAARADDPMHWRALAACCLAITATAIDPPVLQATSSGVQGALRVAPETAAAVVGLYYLVQAGVMVIAGTVGDRVGRKRMMLAGLIGAALFYALAAMAPTPTFWVHVGVVAACFQAIVIPLALANVMVTFGARVRPIAIAVFISVQLLAALSAPALASVLFDLGGWAWTYVPAFGFSLAAIVAVWRRVPENRATEETRWRDLLSLMAWAIGILLVVYAVVASAGGWGVAHLQALLLGIVILASLLILVARSRRGRLHMPHAPFSIVAVTLLAAAAIGLGQSGVLFQLSGFLQGVQGYGPLASGVAIVPFGAATLIGSLAVGVAMERRFRRVGLVEVGWVRGLMVAGLLLAGFSVMSFGLLQPTTPYLPIGLALTGLGAGAAVANVPRTDLLFRAVRPSFRGAAAGLNGSAFILGEALGNSLVTVMLALTVGSAWVARLGQAGIPAETAEELLREVRTRIFVHTAHPYQEPSWIQAVDGMPHYAEVYTEAFGLSMIILGTVLVATALLTRVVLRPARLELDPDSDRWAS